MITDRSRPEQSGGELSFKSAMYTVFLCALFGANSVAVKFSLIGMGAFTTAGIRFCLASVAIFAWACFTGYGLRVSSFQIRQLLLLSSMFTCQIGLFYLGLKYTSATHATLIGNLQPFVVMVLTHFFIAEEQITWRKLFGIILGFFGVFCIFFDTLGAQTDIRLGDLYTLAGVLIWGGSAVYVKYLSSSINPVSIALYPMLPAIPCYLIAGYFFDGGMIRHIDTPVLLGLLYQSFVTASFGFIAWNILLKKYGATALHSFVFLIPVTGVLLGVTLLNEPVTPHLLVAIALVVAGIVAVNSRSRR